MFMQIAFSWLLFLPKVWSAVQGCAQCCRAELCWAPRLLRGSWGSFSSFEYHNLLHCINWWWQTALLWKKLHAASKRGSAAMPQSYTAPSQVVPRWQKPCSSQCTSVLQMFAHTSPCSSKQQSTTSFGNEGRGFACWAEPWSSLHWWHWRQTSRVWPLCTSEMWLLTRAWHMWTCWQHLCHNCMHLISISSELLMYSSPQKVLWCYKTHKLFKYKLQVCKNSIKK